MSTPDTEKDFQRKKKEGCERHNSDCFLSECELVHLPLLCPLIPDGPLSLEIPRSLPPVEAPGPHASCLCQPLEAVCPCRPACSGACTGVYPHTHVLQPITSYSVSALPPLPQGNRNTNECTPPESDQVPSQLPRRAAQDWCSAVD